MGVTKEEIDQIPTCKVCNQRMIVTSSGFYACGKDLTHSRLIEPDGMLPDRARKVLEIMALPVASLVTRNPVTYLVGRKTYSKAKAKVPHDLKARALTRSGWEQVRLIETEKEI